MSPNVIIYRRSPGGDVVQGMAYSAKEYRRRVRRIARAPVEVRPVTGRTNRNDPSWISATADIWDNDKGHGTVDRSWKAHRSSQYHEGSRRIPSRGMIRADRITW